MLSKNELIAILATSLILGFAISLVRSLKIFFITFLIVAIIILINLTAKKITGLYFETEVETKIWEIERYGYKKHNYFKKPIPAGIIFPLVTTAVSLGYISWMAPLTFDVKTRVHRSAKRHGLYNFTAMTEYHLALIAAAGIFANLFFGVIGYLIGFSDFAKLNMYYALFNAIPLSDLDGNKIFFGSLALWSFIAGIALVGLIFAVFII